uniref:Uncharacterized protein n=1 Tax=Glossina morsitans morsitans TaxID=37546 RepID=A0A1B0G5Q8_GLOMM
MLSPIECQYLCIRIQTAVLFIIEIQAYLHAYVLIYKRTCIKCNITTAAIITTATTTIATTTTTTTTITTTTTTTTTSTATTNTITCYVH